VARAGALPARSAASSRSPIAPRRARRRGEENVLSRSRRTSRFSGREPRLWPAAMYFQSQRRRVCGAPAGARRRRPPGHLS
jgi:hypothetical protein